MKQLTLETKEVGQSEKEDESSVKQKQMDARAYRVFFKKQLRKVNASGK